MEQAKALEFAARIAFMMGTEETARALAIRARVYRVLSGAR